MTAEQKVGVNVPAREGTRQHFDELLNQIRQDLVTMGSLVLENVRRAGDAMVESRLDLVEVVRQADDQVDRLYIEAEKLTFETLARQQPVAGDLRFLVSATRILYELERSGDLAYNCVKMLERVGGFPQHPLITPLLEASITASCKVFAQGIDAMAEMVPDAGERLDEADDEVDDLVSEFFTVVGRHSLEIGLEVAIAFSRVGRFLERIADHSVNIGEHVTYAVTAELPGLGDVAAADEGGS